MAFSTAAGYGNLPNGNFSPVIYSKQVQLAFRKASVVGAVTNSDYFGEIANMGDSVKIIKEPEILIFDDCLSAVDTATEEKILAALKDIMQDKTSIIISHRVSTIKHANQIVFLENGQIAEQGTHQTYAL